MTQTIRTKGQQSVLSDLQANVAAWLLPWCDRGWGSEIVVGVVQVAQEMHKGYNKFQPECSTLWADDLTINRQTIAARDILKGVQT